MEGHNHFIHIPKPFILDYNALSRAFGKEHVYLVTNIFLFVAYKSMKSIYKDISFDLNEFCQFFGYTKKEMQRTLRKFIDCLESEKPIIKGHCFEGEFEYALYLGFKHSLIFDARRFYNEGFESESMTLFSHIAVKYKNTGRLEKRIYTVELDYRIRHMQLNRFYLIDLNLYRTIEKRMKATTGGLRNFYLYFGQIISKINFKIKEKVDPSYILTVDQACDIMGIEIQRPDHKKEKVRSNLDDLINTLGENHFNYEFFKGKFQNHKYSIRFRLPEETLDHYDYKKNINNTDTLFLISLGVSISEHYYNKYIGINRIERAKWKKHINLLQYNKIAKSFFDKKSNDYQDGIKLYNQTFIEVFGVNYNQKNDEIE